MFGHLKSYEGLLGGVTKNASGHIIAAKSLHNFWMTHVNFSSIDMDKSGNMAGTAEWVFTQGIHRIFLIHIYTFRAQRIVSNGKMNF